MLQKEQSTSTIKTFRAENKGYKVAAHDSVVGFTKRRPRRTWCSASRASPDTQFPWRRPVSHLLLHTLQLKTRQQTLEPLIPLDPERWERPGASPGIRGLWGDSRPSVLLPQTSWAEYQWDSVFDDLESRPEKRLRLCLPGLKILGRAELEMKQPRVGKQKISGRLISLSHWGVESCTLSIGLKGD